MTVVYFSDCPNWRAAGQRMRQALDVVGQPDTPVRFRAWDAGTSMTDVLEFAGSPTLAVDGVDLFPTQIWPEGVSCRVYLTDAGPAGVPTVAHLVAALRDRTAS